MRQLLSSITCLCFVLLAGCPGTPPVSGGDDEPEVDAGVEVDAAPPAATGQRLTGKTMDYFTPATPMADSTITSDGVQPAMTATSIVGGDYAIDGVPTGSKVYFSVARSPLYRPTRNVPVTIEGVAVVQDLYMITIADANRQYTTAGLPLPVAGKSMLIAELRKNNGTPLDAIPPGNILLLDANNQPVPGTSAPIFMGATDVDPQLLQATIVGGRSRVAILNVPPGNHTLKVTYTAGGGGTTIMFVPVTTVADGATLAQTGGMGGGGGGGMITNPTFATHIYPKLQKASVGGLGCANCHTLGGPAGGVIQFDLGATITLENMQARPGLIDLLAPAQSLLLTKPLYEPAPYNHPNATFIDINDPDYKLFLLWITQGALP
ncbi:MAG: hypothetical protein H0T42_31355 [Deltaproteobacteria bacterium]|nr:hypothetical protein [Deltaproteobacteria bacterium]